MIATAAVATAADFQLGERQIASGSRADFDLPVAAGSDPATSIPVTVFHGAEPGPRILLSAGIHGAEYVPVLAVQRLLSQIDPARLKGTVVIARVAHLSSFLRATVYYNPHDHKNLARVFPGSASGTQSERIAYVFTNELLKNADALIDLHGGDATESLHPFVGVYGGGLAAKQYPLAKRIGLALGIPTLVRYRMDTKAQVEGNGRSPNRQAVADGKATVLVEIGDRGRRDPKDVEMLAGGLLNVLRVLHMLPEAGNPEPVPDVRWIAETASVASTKTGIFYPLKEAGVDVRKGELAGYVTDLLGKTIEELRAPADGVILYMPYAPPLNEGPSSPLVVGIPSKPE